MNERMLDKTHQPNPDEIARYIGEESSESLGLIEEKLKKLLEVNTELKFPFGNNYGWGYKYSCKKKHLFYVFFENKSLCLMVHLNEPKTERERDLLSCLSFSGKTCWENKYPCSDGGWVHYRFTGGETLHDAFIFISLRIKKDMEDFS